MTNEEFDRALDEYAAAVQKSLREESMKGVATMAKLVYPDRIEFQGLVSENGKPESFELLYEFGKALAAKGVQPPPALFVSAEAVTEEGKPCIFISGCTSDGRRNAIRILVEQSRWRKILRPTEIVRLYCKNASFDGETSAGELMRGPLGKSA